MHFYGKNRRCRVSEEGYWKEFKSWHQQILKTKLTIYKESTDLLFKPSEKYASRDPISLMQLLYLFILLKLPASYNQILAIS